VAQRASPRSETDFRYLLIVGVSRWGDPNCPSLNGQTAASVQHSDGSLRLPAFYMTQSLSSEEPHGENRLARPRIIKPRTAARDLCVWDDAPAWNRIIIDDGLGLGDRPWTDCPNGGIYAMAVGPVCYPDCTSKKTWDKFGRIDVLFIHEMTHVWQLLSRKLGET
jgi:hypothetical protein